MKRQTAYFVGCVLLVVLVLGSLILNAETPPTPSPDAIAPARDAISETEVLMRAKLTSSQKVLEGLLAEDFTLIAQGAREMVRISEAAEWPRARDQVYEHYSTELRRQCNKLETLAGKTNHEGASFTYLHITTTCINCHEYVRDALRIADQPNGGVQLIPAHVPNAP